MKKASYETAKLHNMATKIALRQSKFVNDIIKLADKEGVDRDVLMYFAVQPLYETICNGTYKEWELNNDRDI